MVTYLIVATLVLPTLVMGYPVIQCPGNLPPPIAIRVEGCDSTPCYIPRGGTPFEVDFINTASSNTLTLALNSTVFGETSVVDIPPPLNNACLSLVGAICPVGAGQALTHGTTLPVSPELHDGVLVTLHAQIYNDFNLTVFCAVIHVIVL